MASGRWCESHMRSQASALAEASREKDGSWTRMSPLEVVDHRACLDGEPVIPRHSQQQSDNKHSWRKTRKHQEMGSARPVNSDWENWSNVHICWVSDFTTYCLFGWIIIKLGGRMWFGSGKNPLHFSCGFFSPTFFKIVTFSLISLNISWNLRELIFMSVCNLVQIWI